jgi:sarcosine oxidase, subunit beta
MERFGTVVIGGGIVGAAVSYYLTREGESDILLVEQNELASGSTGGSFGGVRQQFSTPLEVELSRRGLEFWKTAASVFDAPVSFDQCGYLIVSGQPEIMARLREAARLQAEMGMDEVHLLEADRVGEAAPWLGTEGLLGGCWTPGDGRVTPPEGVAVLTGAARAAGATVREHWPVSSIRRSGGGWVVSGKDEVEAERVVACTGFWSSELMRPFGLDLTIRPLALLGAITEPVSLGQPVPLTIDLDTGFCVEPEGAALVLAILLEENPPDWNHEQMLYEFAELARRRAPALADVKIARFTTGNVDFGGDGHPYVGEVEPGLFMAAGFGGHGTMHGPAVGRLLAGLIVGRPDQSLDISTLDPRRPPTSAEEWMVATRLQLGLRRLELAGVGEDARRPDPEQQAPLARAGPGILAHPKVPPRQPVHVGKSSILLYRFDGPGDGDVAERVRRIDNADRDVCPSLQVPGLDPVGTGVHHQHAVFQVNPDRCQVGGAVTPQRGQQAERVAPEQVFKARRDGGGVVIGGGHRHQPSVRD